VKSAIENRDVLMRWSQLDDVRGAQIEWCRIGNVPIGAAVDSTHRRYGITIR